MRARFLIAGLLATVATLGTASAADLGQPVYTKGPPPPVPSFFSWTGLYIGVNVGGSWGQQDTSAGSLTNSNQLNGVIGGGQIGYNWQWGSPWVFGLETDIQASGQKRSNAFNDFDVEEKLDWFGTVRARLGYAMGDQGRWLPYVTGGFAYGGNKIDASGTLVSFSQTRTNTGWTVGGGIEWAFADTWSVKAEYLYMDLGNDQTIETITTHHLRDNIGRVGLNLHF